MIDHQFKKKFGQNFISDKNLLTAIVRDSEVEKNDEVLEIGAGAGTLTQILSEFAGRVVSYEIDNDLKDHLLSLNLKNTNFIFGDVMKFSIDEIEENFKEKYKIIANLPYYITTPIIFKFLVESKKVESLCIMVQKEVANRVVAKRGKDYGVLSIMIDFYGSAKIMRDVSRQNFYPVPNVDSSVVLINVDRNKYPDIDGVKFYKFIQTAFSMRRKTLKNNLLKLELNSEKVLSLPQKILNDRPENLSIDEYVELYRKIFK